MKLRQGCAAAARTDGKPMTEADWDAVYNHAQLTNLVKWLDPLDLDPPHDLDLTTGHDRDKVEMLRAAFAKRGFDRTKAALVGYVKDGRVQLLSGTHRHLAAALTITKLPVVLWLASDIEAAWGDLEKWMRIIADIPVAELERWTRADLDNAATAVVGLAP